MMKQKIENLLAQLNSDDIKILPCFYDRPDKVQFRIGLEDGPMVKFSPETDDSYTLLIKDGSGNNFSHAITIPSENFEICQSIRSAVRSLSTDPHYQALKNNPKSFGHMILSLENLIKPLFE